MRNNEIYRNEIKSYIIRAGMTMSEAVEILADEYGWSSSVPNLSDKLKRGSLRYGEAVELADVLGYDIVATMPTGGRSTPARRAFLVLTPKLQWKGNWPDETFNGLTMSGC